MPKSTTCEYCGKKFGTRKIYEHYGACIREKYKDKSGNLVTNATWRDQADPYSASCQSATRPPAQSISVSQ